MSLPRTRSVKEVHAKTGIPVRTLYDEIAKRRLVALHYGETGRAVRLLDDDVSAWIKARRER